MTSPLSSFDCKYSRECSECCLETEMALSEEDLERIQSLEYKKNDFIRNIDSFLILKNIDKSCYFLKEGKCAIYENRPQGCRLYPMIVDFENNSIVIDKSCPNHEQFEVSEYSHLFYDLVNFVDLLLSEKDEREKKEKK